mgnify:CR=1 FL=1
MLRSIRYQSDTTRDPRLDWIRGYAVLAMSINHFGLDASAFHPFTGGAVFLINAAEVFFFVSGLTLGLISSRKPASEAIARCYRRAWEVWVAVLILAAGSVVYEGGGWFAEEPFAFLGAVVTLREAPNWGDVLVAYVVYLLLVPIWISMLAGGRARLALGAVACVYALSQLDPEGLALPVSSFRNLAANAPLFMGGLVIGWHRETIHRWWAAKPWSRLLDAAVVLAGLVGLVLYIWGASWFAWGEALLERFELGRREYAMPPECLAVVAVYLRCGWLLVDRLWGVLDRLLGWATRWIGRSAMTAYVAHAMMMPVAWWIVEALPIEFSTDSTLGATLITTIYLACTVALVAACRWTMRRARSAPSRLALPTLAGPLTACFLLVAGLAMHTAGVRLHEPDAWEYEEDDGWVSEVRGAVYESLEPYDTPDAALVVRAWWVYEPELETAYDELAEVIDEVIAEELDAHRESITLKIDDEDVRAALRARGFDRDDGQNRVVVVVIEAPELEEDETYEDAIRWLEAARDADPETLAIIVLRIEEA